MKTKHTLRAAILVGSVAALLGAPSAKAAPIFWKSATTIAADTDVSNVGALGYAYNLQATGTTVNGVAFTGTTSTTTIGSDVTLSGLGFNFGGFGTSAPGTITAAYKALFLGGNYANGANPTTVTLNNLTVGHQYLTQLWVNDSRAGALSRTDTITGGGGNTVTLNYTNSNSAGGLGQYTTGIFNAGATTQAITVTGNADTQLNAFQLRDVTNLGAWTGTGGATWDAATTVNFATNLYSAALTQADFATAKAPLSAVTFGDVYWDNGATVAVTQTAVTIAAGGVSTGSVLFNNSTVNYTLGNASGVTGITGTTAIGKSGSGTVTLNGANTYTGTTSITDGTLQYNSSDNQTLSGVVSGSGTLTKSGAGTLTLSAQNSFSGVLNINGGILEFSNNDGGGRNVYGSTQININNGATLRVSGANGNIEIFKGRNYTFDSGGGGSILLGTGNYNATTLPFSITTNGGARNNIGLITTSGANGFNIGTSAVATFNVALGSDATSDLTITPIISNSGSIVKSGAGRLTFTATNTYSGGTRIDNGTLTLGHATDTLANGGAVNVNGGTLALGTNTDTVGAVTLTSGSITGTGTGRLTGTGSAFDVRSGTISAKLGGTVGLTKSTAGTVTISSDNSSGGYTGSTIVSNGTLALSGGSNILANTNAVNVNNAAGTFDISAVTTSETIGSLTGVAGSNVVLGAKNLTVGDANDTAFDGVISGATGTLTKVGAGTLTLTGANTYTGTTAISGGILSISSDGNLGAVPGLVTAGSLVINGGTLAITTNDFAINSNRGIALGTTGSTGGTIDVAPGRTLTYGGIIANNGGTNSLTKTNSGTLTLQGTNTYTGATIINGGTLLVGGSITGSVEINDGGTLGSTTEGTGTVGAVTAHSGGTLAPGASTGIISVQGNLNLESGSTFAVEINDWNAGAGIGYDQVQVTGDVSLSGAILSLSGAYGPGFETDIFTIILNNGTNAISGTFSGLANGAIAYASNGQAYQISYFDDFTTDGVLELSGDANAGYNSASLQAVPEPGSMATILGGLGMLLTLQRRRRQTSSR